jgi:hypothetical protein
MVQVEQVDKTTQIVLILDSALLPGCRGLSHRPANLTGTPGC